MIIRNRSESEFLGGNNEGRRQAGGRVLVLAPEPFYEDRGTPIAVQQVLIGLSHLGYEVDVVTYPIGRDLQMEGVKIFRAANLLKIRSVPIGLSLRKIAFDLSMLPVIYGRLRKHNYICIHAVEEAAFPAVIFGRLFGVPVIYDMQSSLPEQLAQYRVFRWIPLQKTINHCEEWLLTNADWVLCFKGLAGRIRSIRPGARFLELSSFSESRQACSLEVAELRMRLQIPEGAAVVAYAGTFEEYQGLRMLVAGIPAILSKVPNTVFVLVGGKGSQGSSICRQALEMGIDKSLRVVSRQERERIPAFLALADVLVSPRLYGGNLPLKIFDYLAAGRPIVATDIPTHRALLNEKNAVLVAPEPHAFADGIVKVLQHPLEAATLGEAACGRASQEFGLKRFLYELDRVYSMIKLPIGGDAANDNAVGRRDAPLSAPPDHAGCGPRPR